MGSGNQITIKKEINLVSKSFFNTSSIPKNISMPLSNKPNKVIIFSQWTSMLDLIEIPLIQKGIKYVRFDGSLCLSKRDKVLREFNELTETMVIIMSLKASAIGINLVAAYHVILLDLWWNPTLEEQAIDRAHRIGQTRDVTIHRLTFKDSVEEKILQLQKHKTNIFRWILGCEHESTINSTK